MNDNRYDDIINLPHHVSTRHAPMSRENRAAQFAPFAALSGYDDAVKEEARLTGKKISLSEDRLALINERIFSVSQRLAEQPLLDITYFKHDAKKTGGEYITVTGTIQSIDEAEGIIILTDKRRISISDLLMIDGAFFYAR